MRSFLHGCDAIVQQLDAAVADTMTRLFSLGRFNRSPSLDDSKAMWEAKRWPRIIANASADALAYLDLLTEQLSSTLSADRAAFEAALATFPDKVRRRRRMCVFCEISCLLSRSWRIALSYLVDWSPLHSVGAAVTSVCA